MKSDWLEAAATDRVSFPNLLALPLGASFFGTKTGFALVDISFEDLGPSVWGATSLMIDGVLSCYGLTSRGFSETEAVALHEHGVLVRRVYLSTRNIDMKAFREVYGEVPCELAYRFVLQHELGHVICGASEAKADEYAFNMLNLTGDAELRAIRNEKRANIHNQLNGLDLK